MIFKIASMRPRKCTGRSAEHSVLCDLFLWLLCSHVVREVNMLLSINAEES